MIMSNNEITKQKIRDKIKEIGVEDLEKNHRVKYETILNLAFEGNYAQAWEMLEALREPQDG